VGYGLRSQNIKNTIWFGIKFLKVIIFETSAIML